MSIENGWLGIGQDESVSQVLSCGISGEAVRRAGLHTFVEKFQFNRKVHFEYTYD